ncbi:MAG: sigma-70 family RNA polymerase sigma factor [Sarcina sp.]
MNQTRDEILHQVYNDTYDEILKYIISKCNNIEDAKDILQNVYFNFYKALEKKKIENYNKYIFKIAKNEIYKTYGILGIVKNNIPIFSLGATELEFNKDDALRITDDFDANLICNEIYSYLKQSNTLTFKIFILHFKCDMKIKDISKTLNISESTVKNKLYRTIKELKKTFNI